MLESAVRFYDDKVPSQEIIWTKTGATPKFFCFEGKYFLLEKFVWMNLELLNPVGCENERKSVDLTSGSHAKLSIL